jgi:hypothetical protein
MTNCATIVADSIDPTNSNNSASTSLYVTPVHNGPVLPAQADLVLSSASTLVITNTAFDQDIPVTTLTYQLIAPPEGAAIDTNGVIRWIPPQNAGSGAYMFQTVVTDNGVQRFSATNSFSVSIAASASIQPPLTLSLTVIRWRAHGATARRMW